MKRILAVVAIVMILTLALSATASAYYPVNNGYPGGNTYIVQRGDTLSAIAFRFGVSMFELGRANGVFNPNLIFVGQCLRIPAPMYGGGYGNNVGYGGGYCQPQCEQPCYNVGYCQPQCEQPCYGGGYGNNVGYWGGYNGGYNGGYWGGGYNGCGENCGGNYYGFAPTSYTLERNLSTTFERNAKG